VTPTSGPAIVAPASQGQQIALAVIAARNAWNSEQGLQWQRRSAE